MSSLSLLMAVCCALSCIHYSFIIPNEPFKCLIKGLSHFAALATLAVFLIENLRPKQ